MVQIAKKHTDKKSVYTEEKEMKTRRLLKKMRKETEEEGASNLAKKHKLPYLDMNLVPVSKDTVKLLPEEDSTNFKLALFQKAGNKAKIALADPENEEAKKYIENLKKENGWEIIVCVVSNSSIQKLLDFYKEVEEVASLDIMHMSLSGKDLEEFEKKFGDLIDLKNRMREISTSEIVRIIMGGAIEMKSSDIHFEPEEENVRIRFRVDGVLQEIGRLPDDIYNSIVSRVKMMGKMKINIRDMAQDGHFSIQLNSDTVKEKQETPSKKTRVDVRVNVIPGNFGESIVMRLLNQADVLVSIDDLGIQGLAYEEIKKQISKPNGMILTTGPTGSGKTTTLYSLVNRLNTADVKIITIEDPVEYQISGISQTQVHADRGYTFGTGLRAIVRQDPDIILIGEIRDEETAEVAINSALTGHLVLSTLHTNSASASIPRLIELGIKPTIIPPSINALMAQRLVRKLCLHCRKSYKPAQETVELIKRLLKAISPKAKIKIPKNFDKLYMPTGCVKCNNLGFKGRIGIFEVLTINVEIEKLIMNMAGETEITKAALNNGMVTMAQDGILKALEGITSLEEVWRVAGQADLIKEIDKELDTATGDASTTPTEEIP